MTSNATFRKLALAFEDAIELPHFDKASFRVSKKIFATLNKKFNRACLKLSEDDQSLFSSYDKSIIYPVPNKWGKHGWTLAELQKMKPALTKAMLTAAYQNVLVKKSKSTRSKKAR